MKAIRVAIIGILVLACSTASALGNVVAAAPAKAELQHLRWKGKTVNIAISNSLTRSSSNIKIDSDVMGAIRRSFDAWSKAADIDLQMEFSERQSVSTAGVAGDGVSLITIAQSPENVLFFSKDSDSASAKTRIFFNRKGLITEADIVLNPFQQFSTDGTYGTFDLESTLTHEIGHLLGLHHSGVLGATMAESFARNGTMGIVDLGPRTLTESDIAAIRELYGPRTDVVCCSAINGRLIAATGRPVRGLQIWTEDTETGRVMGQAESGPDGTFRIGGLPAGEYSVYWKTKDILETSSTGSVGNVTLETGENKQLNEKIVVRPSATTLQYLGLNSQLADCGISLSAGRSYLINLGGRNLDPDSVKISFSSPSIKIAQFPITPQEFGEGVSGISFMVTVDPHIASGQYSIFVNGKNGPTSALMGALSIE